MSLENTQPAHTYRLGLLCSRDFDSRDLLDDMLGAKLATISHLYTNGVNALVTDWARENGLPYTVYPISGGRGLPASTRDVVEASDVVLIIASAESKSAEQIATICRDRAARERRAHEALPDNPEPVFKWRLQEYEPINHWRAKVQQVAEIVEAVPEDERTDGLNAIAGVVA